MSAISYISGTWGSGRTKWELVNEANGEEGLKKIKFNRYLNLTGWT